MSKKKRIASYILAACVVVLFLVTIILTTLNCTILSTLNVKKKIVEASYYAEDRKIIVEASKDYVMQSGFDESIMDGVVNEYDVKIDTDGLIDYIYEGREYTVQSNLIRANLDKNIQEYMQANNYEVDEENQKNITEFENKIEEIYKRNIEYSGDSIKQVAQTMGKIKKFVPILMIICGIIFVVLFLLLKETNKPAAGISILATGAVLVFLKFYTGVSVAINNILLMNRAFSNTLIIMANQVIQKLFVVGVALCVIGLVWIIYTEVKKKIVKMELLEEHSQIIR